MCEHCPLIGVCYICQGDDGRTVPSDPTIDVELDLATPSLPDAGLSIANQYDTTSLEDNPTTTTVDKLNDDAVVYTGQVYLLCPMLGWYVQDWIDADGRLTVQLTNDTRYAMYYRSYADAMKARRNISTLMRQV